MSVIRTQTLHRKGFFADIYKICVFASNASSLPGNTTKSPVMLLAPYNPFDAFTNSSSNSSVAAAHFHPSSSYSCQNGVKILDSYLIGSLFVLLVSIVCLATLIGAHLRLGKFVCFADKSIICVALIVLVQYSLVLVFFYLIFEVSGEWRLTFLQVMRYFHACHIIWIHSIGIDLIHKIWRGKTSSTATCTATSTVSASRMSNNMCVNGSGGGGGNGGGGGGGDELVCRSDSAASTNKAASPTTTTNQRRQMVGSWGLRTLKRAARVDMKRFAVTLCLSLVVPIAPAIWMPELTFSVLALFYFATQTAFPVLILILVHRRSMRAGSSKWARSPTIKDNADSAGSKGVTGWRRMFRSNTATAGGAQQRTTANMLRFHLQLIWLLIKISLAFGFSQNLAHVIIFFRGRRMSTDATLGLDIVGRLHGIFTFVCFFRPVRQCCACNDWEGRCGRRARHAYLATFRLRS